jgi:membrane-bound ClpP family serine protease
MNTPAEIAAGAAEIRRIGAQNVVVSMGKAGALLHTADGTWLVHTPKIQEKNPIGAGDSMVGGLVWALTQNIALKDALGWGVASGAATASLPGTEVGTRPLIEELFKQVRFEKLETVYRPSTGNEAKVEIIVNPKVAYILIFTGIMLLLIIFNDTKYSWPKFLAMIFCIVAGVAEFLVLDGNPWAFLIVVLSPLPYFVAIRQERFHSLLILFTIFMLTIGSAYLFVDEKGRPFANLGVAGMVSVFGGLLIWLVIERKRIAGKAQLIGETLVGMTGQVWIAIEPFSIGSVRIEGEIWQARSKEILPAGTLVRVIRQDGATLTVKKIENIKSSIER